MELGGITDWLGGGLAFGGIQTPGDVADGVA
jgi:hypothetical protein